MTPKRLLAALVGAGTALLAPTAAVHAHETWIVPPSFSVAAGTPLDVQLTTGALFPTPEFNTQSDDVVYARLRQGQRVVELKDRDTQPKTLRLRGPALAPGTAVVHALLPPAEVQLSLTQVAEYFDEIKASAAVRSTWAAQRRQQASWTESFTKQAKTCIRVGTGDDKACRRAVGLPLEIVPLDTVFGVKAGQTIRVRLLWQGKPMAGASLGHIVEPQATRHFATTDADGVAAISIATPGRAMIFSVYLRPLQKIGTWESDFTTLTLQVEP
jgi:uncharacterized GH25 family protein